jgi:hypothetical protein
LGDKRRSKGREEQDPADAEGDTPCGRTIDEVCRKKQGAEPARDRHACEKPETPDLLIPRLARELDTEEPLRTRPFGLDLIALELEPLMITVERLFQCSDHHTGQTRLERASASADGQLIGIIRRGGGCRASFHDTRDLVDAENRIQNAKPGDSHQFNQLSRKRF